MSTISFWLTLPLVLGQLPSLIPNPLTTIVSVVDGDTVRVNHQGKTITVQLACIDAPEVAQTPFGLQSANRLKDLLPRGQVVQLREVGKDSFGRTVAELFLGKQSVNLKLLQEGQAVVDRVSLACAAVSQQYLSAEAQAQTQQLGFWNQRQPMMPWEFRQGQGGSAANCSTTSSGTNDVSFSRSAGFRVASPPCP